MGTADYVKQGLALAAAVGASGYGMSEYDRSQLEVTLLEMRQEEREHLREENRREEIELRNFVFANCANWRDPKGIGRKLREHEGFDGK